MVQLHSLAPSTCLSWTCGWLRLPMPKRTALLLANGAYTLLGESLWQVIESLNINMVSQSHFSGTHFHYHPFTFHVAIMFWGWHLGICLCSVICVSSRRQGVTGVTWNWGSGRLYHDLSPCRPPWQRSWRPRFSMFLSSPGSSHFKICMRNTNSTNLKKHTYDVSNSVTFRDEMKRFFVDIAGDGLQSPVGRWPELARDEGIEICVEKAAVDFYQNLVAVDS